MRHTMTQADIDQLTGWTEAQAKTLQDLGDICDATPAAIVDELAAMATPQWRDFIATAKAAAAVFALRGHLPEDVELA